MLGNLLETRGIDMTVSCFLATCSTEELCEDGCDVLSFIPSATQNTKLPSYRYHNSKYKAYSNPLFSHVSGNKCIPIFGFYILKSYSRSHQRAGNLRLVYSEPYNPFFPLSPQDKQQSMPSRKYMVTSIAGYKRDV